MESSVQTLGQILLRISLLCHVCYKFRPPYDNDLDDDDDGDYDDDDDNDNDDDNNNNNNNVESRSAHRQRSCSK